MPFTESVDDLVVQRAARAPEEDCCLQAPQAKRRRWMRATKEDPPPAAAAPVAAPVISVTRKRSALSVFNELKHWQSLQCLVNTKNTLGNRQTPEGQLRT